MIVAITANISWAKQEHVYLTCSTDISSLPAFSLHFQREQDWADGWDWHGDWNNQAWPTFDTTTIINLSDRAVDGKVHGQFLGGRTRLTGHTRIAIDAENESLNLSLLKNPWITNASGIGSFLGEGFNVSCTIAVEADQSIDVHAGYKRYRWIYEDGKKVCYDDKAGNVVSDSYCKFRGQAK